ncbi:hypothetical protein D3Z52_19655 [Clostridiaceae bacterium]|nr:hypothetical protein [Clostridiaceae bacterium]
MFLFGEVYKKRCQKLYELPMDKIGFKMYNTIKIERPVSSMRETGIYKIFCVNSMPCGADSAAGMDFFQWI